MSVLNWMSSKDLELFTVSNPSYCLAFLFLLRSPSSASITVIGSCTVNIQTDRYIHLIRFATYDGTEALEISEQAG
jgi:hypothetical protein